MLDVGVPLPAGELVIPCQHSRRASSTLTRASSRVRPWLKAREPRAHVPRSSNSRQAHRARSRTERTRSSARACRADRLPQPALRPLSIPSPSTDRPVSADHLSGLRARCLRLSACQAVAGPLEDLTEPDGCRGEPTRTHPRTCTKCREAGRLRALRHEHRHRGPYPRVPGGCSPDSQRRHFCLM